MEIKPGETCLLWERTKDMARERGYGMSATCPMDKVCDGRKCVYIATPSSKWEDKKLSELRRELRSLG